MNATPHKHTGQFTVWEGWKCGNCHSFDVDEHQAWLCCANDQLLEIIEELATDPDVLSDCYGISIDCPDDAPLDVAISNYVRSTRKQNTIGHEAKEPEPEEKPLTISQVGEYIRNVKAIRHLKDMVKDHSKQLWESNATGDQLDYMQAVMDAWTDVNSAIGDL